MHIFSRTALSALMMASVGLPVLAQSPSAGSATTAPATHDTTSPVTGNPTAPASKPSQRNAVLTDQNDIRASKLIGSSVYNDRDEKIGSIDDIVLGKDNTTAQVILSVGGFLGMGAKLVALPCQQLQLGDTQRASSDNKVVIPGATKESLKALPDFHYAAT